MSLFNRRSRLIMFTLGGLGLFGVVVAAAPYFTSGGSAMISMSALVSPGALSVRHEPWDEEPNGGCQQCHTAGAGLSEQKCLECHEDLQRRIEDDLGYHAQQAVKDQECFACHSGHLGRETRLIRWPQPETPFEVSALDPDPKVEDEKRAKFAHEEGTGFALNGAHAELDCEQCHRASLIRDAQLVGAEVAFLRKHDRADDAFGQDDFFESFLGVGAVCGDCHQDAHLPSMGADCAECHSEQEWKIPSFVEDHNRPPVRYPLEGKHAEVACNECHINGPTQELTLAKFDSLPAFEHVVAENVPPVFRGVGFGEAPAIPVSGSTLPDCQNCHPNPHRQNSKTFLDCKSCHTPADWELDDTISNGFDHNDPAIGFVLDGAHVEVTCAECHGQAVPGAEYGEVLAAAAQETCWECHEDDERKAHAGSFDREMALARGQTCELCHSTSDWETSTYDLASHPETVPLIERHAAISCEDCHGKQALEALCTLEKGGKDRCVTGPPFPRLPAEPGAPVGQLESDCTSCHVDPHEGKLTDPLTPGGKCVDCHGYKAWHLSDLDLAGHEKLGFKVRGAHLELFQQEPPDCDSCHGGRTAEGGLRQVAIADWQTKGCVVCHDDIHLGQFGREPDCATCHNEKEWLPSEFTLAQHQNSRFPLTAAHLSVPCEVCHEVKQVRLRNGAAVDVQQFKWKGNVTCVRCHETPHGDQFRGQGCESCHTEQDWMPSTFDAQAHAKTGFLLEGPHDAACASCHVPRPSSEVVEYENTPTACDRCHQDVHLGQFNRAQWRAQGCEGCHVIESWKPSTFTAARHDKESRFQLKGAHALVRCDRCHFEVDKKWQGDAVKVTHYYPIEARACDDCHKNPHEVTEKK